MADDSKQPFPNIGGNGFIRVLLVAAGTFFVAQQVPLQGSRPASTERSIRERVGEQHVDARLWQDPFAAVADYLAKSPSLKPENCDGHDGRHKDIETYCRPPLKTPKTAKASEKANPDAPEKGRVDPLVKAPADALVKPSGEAPDLTLVVSASGASYSEDQEARRRRRYAVLAGLNAEGFVPEDPQHIGFFWPDAAGSRPASQTIELTASAPGLLSVHLSGTPLPSATLPKTVPYEWFKPRPERVGEPRSARVKEPTPERVKTKKGYRILLLWFDEDTLAANAPGTSGPAPLRQFARLLCPYLPAEGTPPDKVNVKILGPQLSTTLRAVVDEVNSDDWPKGKDWSSGSCRGSAPPHFYVSDATVSDATLIPEDPRPDVKSSSCLGSDTCLRDFFHAKGIELYRLTATDDALARTIRTELALRGVDQENTPSKIPLIAELHAISAALVGTVQHYLRLPSVDESHHIALISEWDTLYGRTLPDAMARCLGSATCKPDNSDPDPNWLHRYKYLRGLDGQMPNVAGLDSGNGAKDSDNRPNKDGKNSAKDRPDPSTKDRAEGQGQYDYLRRLGDRIQQLDADLRRKDQRGIEAVGVLGSDVYDKLLVLQALRPLLPDAWFFTTDLDALLLHPGAQTLTRNLLVASSFGLQLEPDVQGEIPPFRSSYQTAEFLATRVAIRGGIPKQAWLNPLLFEIGSSRAFQFASQSDGDSRKTKAQEPLETDAAGSAKSEVDNCKNDLLSCDKVQPPGSAMAPQASIPLVIVFSALGLCVALIPRAPRNGAWNRVNAFMAPSERKLTLAVKFMSLVVGLGLVIAAVAIIIHILWQPVAALLTDHGQPMTLLEGISVWPTIFLRVAAFVSCIWLIRYSWRCLDGNLAEIVQDFHLKQTWNRVRAEQARIVSGHRPWVGFAARFWYPTAADGSAAERGVAPSFQSVSSGWGTYVYQGSLSSRMWRVTGGIVAMLLLWATLSLVFGQPRAPARGDLSLHAYEWVTFFLVFATLFLVFFVADTTLLSWGLIRAFHKGSIVWPPEALQKYGDRLGFKPQSCDQPGREQRCLDDWLALIFLSKRTKCITGLLYWPFLIIALIVVSRSRLFANYNASIPDLVTMGVGVLIVTACAMVLRRSAEASRKTALRRLNDQIAAARSFQSETQLASQLELLLHRVEELREGAFSPFSQQPVVRAMLLPLGSLGGTALLEYLLIPGFG
jgi:hypothetical protein